MTLMLSSVLLLILSGGLVAWAYRPDWGYYPERGLAVVVVALLAFWLSAHL